jgi:DNA-binding NarL/FixJ family response regulator
MHTKHILIVEDDSFCYDGIKNALQEQGFSVSEYTPSVDSALKAISSRKPDLALLDIQLKGDKDGIFLADLLSKKYDIPCIILTSLNNDYTFHKSLNAGHENFLIKKKSDYEDIVRTVITSIHKREKEKKIPKKENKIGINVLTSTRSEIRNAAHNQPVRVPILYKDIVVIIQESEAQNYKQVITKDNKKYYYDKPLKNIIVEFPEYFAKINRKCIINLHYVKGLSYAGNVVKLLDKEYQITRTYREDFEKRFQKLFGDN